ncbi:MAG: class I SAM-dependent methyltransferase [Gammaproteobacteria bacterium]|nr:class I SAM-dependent methyltransferase [Gammaproteobacteria bacterium]MCZ6892531.1 class I SAM-dependent methyltransferase [Gammaproteobacteria bacterium]
MNQPNPEQLKQQQHKTWSTVADGWHRRHELLARCSAPVTARMLELAHIGTGAAVLDIASGSGEPAISAARRVGAGGSVLGTDLVEDMLVYARAHAQAAGLENIEFRCIDSEMLELEAGTFDAATMRWGLMFMPDPIGVLERVRRALRSGAHIALTCWAEPDRNPFISLSIEVLRNYCEVPQPPPGTPGMFAFADRKRITETMEAAGFIAVSVEDMEIITFEADTADEYWKILYDLAGPVAVLYNEMDEKSQKDFVEEFTGRVTELSDGTTFGLKGTTWIAAGEKP